MRRMERTEIAAVAIRAIGLDGQRVRLVAQVHAEPALQATRAEERVDQLGVRARDDAWRVEGNRGIQQVSASGRRRRTEVSAVSPSETTALFAARSKAAKDE